MKLKILGALLLLGASFFISSHSVSAAGLEGSTTTAGTVNVAMPITDLQITGEGATTVPVKLLVTSGTLAMSTTTGLTFDGATSGAVLFFSGTITNLNAALASLTYTRGSAGTDTLEVSLVEPGEVFFPDNGHLYEYVADVSTWQEANTAAALLTKYDSAGYLTTITSLEENAFVADRLDDAGWMGASDSAIEGDWKWVTGPENGTSFWSGLSGGSTVGGNYENWATGEPNNSSEEDCAQFLSGASGQWNDLNCGVQTLPGYVVEYGASGDLPTVAALDIAITTETDIDPVVSITSPTEGVSFPEDQEFTITATASDADGTVESVKFFIEDQQFLIFADAPYTEGWTLVDPGEYTLLAVAEDDDGNISTSTAVTFTITDATLPTTETLSPLDNATGVAVNSDLIITFDETVDSETGNIVLKKASDDSTVETFDVTTDITGSGTDTITIDPATDLGVGIAYYIQIDATAFDDTAGNSFAGITDTTTWSFTAAAPSSGGGGRVSLSEADDDTEETQSTEPEQLFTSPDTFNTMSLEEKSVFIKTLIDKVTALRAQLQMQLQGSGAQTAVRDLTVGMEGEDVRMLQELLIAEKVGPAAAELTRVTATGYFSSYTKNALGEYQQKNGILPYVGYFGVITRNQMKAAGLTGLWW